MFHIILILHFFISVNSQSFWPSPCPKQFRYIPESIKPGEWSGIINLTADEDLTGIWVRLTLDGQPIDVTTNFGIINYRTSPFPNASDYLIRKTNERLQNGQNLEIRITVVYDESKPIPLLVGYRLNARVQCPESNIIDPMLFERPKIDRSSPSSEVVDVQETIDVSIENFISPCPKQFRYDTSKPGEWTGTIILIPDEQLKGVWIRITLDSRPDKVETNLGIIDYKNSSFENAAEYLIRKTNEILTPGEVKEVKITVSYDPSTPPPLFVGYRLNAKPQCPENGIIDLALFKRPLKLTQFGIETKNVDFEGNNWPSTCPKQFRYLPDSIKPGEWSGVINLIADEDLPGVWVRLTLDGQPIDVTTDFGIINYRISPFPNASDYLIRKTNERLRSGENLEIRITVKYDESKPVPLLVGYRLNARVQCPENGIIDPSLFQRPNRLSSENGGSTTERFRPEIVTPQRSVLENIETVTTPEIPPEMITIQPEIITIQPEIIDTAKFTQPPIIDQPQIITSQPQVIIPQPGRSSIEITQTGTIGIIEPGTKSTIITSYPGSSTIDISKPGTISINQPGSPIKITNVGMPSKKWEENYYEPPELKSPCPDVFDYIPPKNFEGLDRWFGVINWVPKQTVDRVVISIILDHPGQQLGNWFSQVVTKDNIKYNLMKNDTFPEGKLVRIKFFVKVNPYSYFFPELKDIVINGESVCKRSPTTLYENESFQIIKHNDYTEIKIYKTPETRKVLLGFK